MSDEGIRERLKRLRRGLDECTGQRADATHDAAEARVPTLAGWTDPAVTGRRPAGAADPAVSGGQLERADNFAAAEAARRSLAARLMRRLRGEERPEQPVVAGDPARNGASGGHGAAAEARELALGAPRDLLRSERGTWARTSTFARSHRHGSSALEEVLRTCRATLAERARDERLSGVDLDSALFFDTETTGLSGGAGTYVFLVGLGRFVEDRFELWQGFLPHPADEKALLEEVAGRIASASAIVSFFGKSFDRHRLEDKMRLHGVSPPFADCIHLDLYYPLRRAHRGKFENCRLKTLERELAGVQRADDLPGSFAPAAWFDFLAQRPHRLEGVFRHNADDVLSLVALATHLGG